MSFKEEYSKKLVAVMVNVLPLLFTTLLAAIPAAARPDFQLSGFCGQVWDASTYQGHWNGDEDALDITIRDTELANRGLGEPVLAMAPGTIAKSAIENDGEYRIFIDHVDGWRTHYIHNIDEDFGLIDVGRRVTQGEVLGWTGKSGSSTIHQHIAQVNPSGTLVRQEFDGVAATTHEADTATWKKWGKADAEKIMSTNCAGNRFMSWSDSGDKYAMLYRPSDGKVQIKRLNDNGTTTNTWSGSLGLGWMHFESYHLGIHPHAIFYEASTGEVAFMRLDSNGGGLTVRGDGTWYDGWTHIVSFRRENRTYLLIYSSLHGFANLERVRPDGTGTINLKKRTWEVGRTSNVFYQAGPRQYLLTYRGGTGRMRVHQINGSGDDLRFDEVWTGSRKRNWTTLVPISDSGRTYLFGYNAMNGNAKLWQLDSEGQSPSPTKDLSMQKDWSAFTPWLTPEGGKLLAYKICNGRARSFRIKTGGTGLDAVQTGNWATGWQ